MNGKSKLRQLASLVILLVAWRRAEGVGEGQPQVLEKKKFTVCGKTLSLEIAKTPAERERGLMFRDSVKPGTGMIFVFPELQPLSFWMRNVSFDIDIGYFDKRGRLLNFLTMLGTSPLVKPESLPNYPSSGPALYAVEVEKNFYSKLSATQIKNCRITPLPKVAQ